MEQKQLILFLSDGMNCLHLVAQCYAQEVVDNSIDIISASMTPPKLNSLTAKVMHQAGKDITTLPRLTLLDIEIFRFDLIITLGDFDQSCRPTLPGMPPHMHWDVPDPKPGMDQSSVLEALDSARDQLRQKVSNLFATDIINALFATRQKFDLILDNLLDGVMAHTTSRRIFYFNKAAEKITGYESQQLLGKDCHDVFPGRFCGGECDFCSGLTMKPIEETIQRNVVFKRPDGKERNLKMSIMTLSDVDGKGVGALLSFKDDTELNILKGRLKHHHALGNLVGRDPKTLTLFDQIREVSSVNIPVHIEGESGTGKELVANAIHHTSSRANQPIVAINCGALPEGVLESELFGHVRGAFSGATQNRKGRFELADKGTIFLDEVSELSPSIQVKLLRVLQEQQFEPVGAEHSIKVDVRVISATNQNLRKLIEKKKFRRDLYYRLCVVPIIIPPLRERRLDIPMLVEHFLELTAEELKRPVLTPSNEVIDLLTSYEWPGNVRELRNAIEYAYVKCRTGIINKECLPPEILLQESPKPSRPGPPLKSREHILQALEKAKGNKRLAAEMLGIGRATLYRYLSLYGLK